MAGSIQDILMYSREVYHYYLGMYGETYAGFRWVNMVLGLVPVFLLVPVRYLWPAFSRFRNRLISVLLVYCWAWVGIVFHLMWFTRINYVAYGLGGLFLLEAAFLFVFGTVLDEILFVSPEEGGGNTGRILQFWAGAVIYLSGLLVVPLLMWYETGHVLGFGWGAGSTAAGTLGLLLLVRKRSMQYFLTFLPLMYCLYICLRAYAFQSISQYALWGICLMVPVFQLWIYFQGEKHIDE